MSDLYRLAEILWVFVLHLLLYPFSSLLRDKSFGERLRLALERLGIVWVKIGQMLAARSFFKPSAQTELERLWDATQPLPFSVIKPIVERAVGQPISSYFDRFDEAAYASASIAQTHVAYRQGKKKMVKVRRPGVLGKMRQDVRLAKRLIYLGSLVSQAMWCIKSAHIPEQAEVRLLQEVDFRREKENAVRFRAGYKSEYIVVPEVDFAVEDVLIEEFLDGIPCNRWKEEFRAQGLDPQASVRNFLPPTFGPGFRGIPVPVHGDPHPANLIIMSDGRMGIVDFGYVGIVTKQDINLLNDAVFAVYAGNVERTVDALLRLGNFSFKNERRHRAFRNDIAKYVRECHTRPFDYWISEMSAIQIRHGVPTADNFALIGSFGILANKVAQMFFLGSTTLDLVGAEIRAGMQEQMRKRLANIDPLPFLYACLLQAEEAPRHVATFVEHPVETLAGILETLVAPLQQRKAA